MPPLAYALQFQATVGPPVTGNGAIAVDAQGIGPRDPGTTAIPWGLLNSYNINIKEAGSTAAIPFASNVVGAQQSGAVVFDRIARSVVGIGAGDGSQSPAILSSSRPDGMYYLRLSYNQQTASSSFQYTRPNGTTTHGTFLVLNAPAA